VVERLARERLLSQVEAEKLRRAFEVVKYVQVRRLCEFSRQLRQLLFDDSAPRGLNLLQSALSSPSIHYWFDIIILALFTLAVGDTSEHASAFQPSGSREL
jgi:hypothetical protein